MRENADQNNSDYGHFSRNVDWGNSRNMEMIIVLKAWATILQYKEKIVFISLKANPKKWLAGLMDC